jgi:hypothetical protein
MPIGGLEGYLTITYHLMRIFPNYSRTYGQQKQYNGMLVSQFDQINKKENETMSQFDTRFNRLYSHVLTYFYPTTAKVHLLYVNAFDGEFFFILKDKNPTSLAQSKEYNENIE